MNPANRVICFDFGLQRIGVATGNTLTKTTQGLTVIPATNGNPDWRELAAVVSQWRPDRLVVGLPLMMNGIEGEMAKMVRSFGLQLEKRLAIPIVFIDERLTSSMADALFRETTEQRRSLTHRQKRNRDSLAAELILNTYFEENPT